MNPCRRIQKILSLFSTGDLDEAAARRVRMHLAGCAECREFSGKLAQSQAALAAFREKSAAVEQESLWPELSLRVARLRREPSAVRGWAPVGALAAACLAVYVWGSTSWPGVSRRPGVRIPISTRIAAEEVRPGSARDVPVQEDPFWTGSNRTQPVLPNAQPVMLRSRRF